MKTDDSWDWSASLFNSPCHAGDHAYNVVFWLQRRGIAASNNAAVDRIFAKAKESPCVLSEDDVCGVLARQR